MIKILILKNSLKFSIGCCCSSKECATFLLLIFSAQNFGVHSFLSDGKKKIFERMLHGAMSNFPLPGGWWDEPGEVLPGGGHE